jgi:hypothetical protein
MKRMPWRWLIHGRVFSPQGLLLRAAVILFAFLVLHAFGLRDYTTLLSGASPTGQRPDMWTVCLGMAYVAAWFGVVLIVPVLVLGSGIYLVLQRRMTRTAPSN